MMNKAAQEMKTADRAALVMLEYISMPSSITWVV